MFTWNVGIAASSTQIRGFRKSQQLVVYEHPYAQKDTQTLVYVRALGGAVHMCFRSRDLSCHQLQSQHVHNAELSTPDASYVQHSTLYTTGA